MTLLPNYEQAFIAIEKHTDYCLDLSHPIGREKATVFKSVLDLTDHKIDMRKNRTERSLPKVLDIVALLKDMPDEKLAKGQVGTIAEELDEGVYEVEFADKQGKTTDSLTLASEDLMLLHFEPETII